MPRPKDRDGIYKRPDSPYWWASWVDGNGTRQRSSTRCLERRSANQWLVRKQTGSDSADQSNNVSAPSDCMVFGELAEMYLKDLAGRSRSREMPSAFIILMREFKDIPLPLTGTHIREYTLLRRGQGVSDSTIVKELSYCSAALNWGNRDLELGLVNPVPGRKPSPAPPRHIFYTADEVNRLLAAARAGAQADYMPDLIELSLYSGMRLGEAVDLTWHQVDETRAAVRFTDLQQKANRNDWIPINSHMSEIFRRRKRIRQLHSDCVFHRQGEPLKWRTVSVAFLRLRRRIGIEGTFHALRHTFGSWLLNDGVDLAVISRLMRHADISLTLRVYGHFTTERLETSSERIVTLASNLSRK